MDKFFKKYDRFDNVIKVRSILEKITSKLKVVLDIYESDSSKELFHLLSKINVGSGVKNELFSLISQEYSRESRIETLKKYINSIQNSSFFVIGLNTFLCSKEYCAYSYISYCISFYIKYSTSPIFDTEIYPGGSLLIHRDCSGKELASFNSDSFSKSLSLIIDNSLELDIFLECDKNCIVGSINTRHISEERNINYIKIGNEDLSVSKFSGIQNIACNPVDKLSIDDSMNYQTIKFYSEEKEEDCTNIFII